MQQRNQQGRDLLVVEHKVRGPLVQTKDLELEGRSPKVRTQPRQESHGRCDGKQEVLFLRVHIPADDILGDQGANVFADVLGEQLTHRHEVLVRNRHTSPHIDPQHVELEVRRSPRGHVEADLRDQEGTTGVRFDIPFQDLLLKVLNDHLDDLEVLQQQVFHVVGFLWTLVDRKA